MLPPILEICVVRHPKDLRSVQISDGLFDHFHGTSFSGLIGGAVEVYDRSEGWKAPDDSPRPLPLPGTLLPNELKPPNFVAVVLVVGRELVRAAEPDGPWASYIGSLCSAASSHPGTVALFPYYLGNQGGKSRVRDLAGSFQSVGSSSGMSESEPDAERVCRDLAQSLTQRMTPETNRLRVFISHTRHSSSEEDDVVALVRLVREVIEDTRLSTFFDAQDLQPGCDWDEELRIGAASSALLSIRSDLYSSRAWCQREVRIAKESGMPVVILDSLSTGEERGCFLMDHVPRLPIRSKSTGWNRTDVRRGLNLLVDECLKRALWRIQKQLAPNAPVDWWAPHAPEPLTLGRWLSDTENLQKDRPLRILHPDPPLGDDEREALDMVAALAGYIVPLEVMTPRGLSARGS